MKTVLVADNDAFQRQLVDMLLAVDDYKIIGFATGRQVLEYLQSNVPDVAILDYSLPDINGADLCAKIRGVKRLSKIPVILVTSDYKLSLVKGIAVAVKANVVLTKPLGDKKLREQVRALVKPKPIQPQEALSMATPLVLDPILEQTLDQLPHLTQSHESLHNIEIPELPSIPEPFDQSVNLAEPLPPLDIADLIDMPSLETSLPQLFQDSLPPEPTPTPTYETPQHPIHTYVDSYDPDPFSGTISEQELLDSLRVRLDEGAPTLSPQPSPDSGPQVYRLPDLEQTANPILPLQSSQSIPQYASLEVLKEQVEQLGSENEQLKITLRELDSGHPLHASHSYLNAIEELEMLRRLTGIQAKQLNELQNHNQSLLEEVQLLKSQRRSGFFGFRSGKKSDRDTL